TDISLSALAMARKNAHQHNIRNIRFREGHWLEALDNTCEIIVSNPPYIRTDDKHLHSPEISHEPLLALDGGADGLMAIREIIQSAPAWLRPGGWLVIEHGYDQAGSVQKLLQQNAFIDIQTDHDYAGIERLTYACYDP
ncbi:MAG TPA: HemK/PrmC family methyltransferase, partial [Gammaproteobacteria bacterium]|nr:HemK/PrmC family methyltransferase [Gammaproteobacteria bacterium]